MYLDQLDDIRSIPHTKNFERNCALAQASIMKNIIQGKRIVLSETNIITSFPVLKMLEDDYFIKLFEENIINVAVCEKSLKRLQTNDFKEVIIDKLQQGLGDDKREPFYFPAIDVFDKDKLYSDNAIKNREEPRKIAIDIFRNNGLTHSDYPGTQSEYFEALRNFAIVLSKVSNPINCNKVCRSGISSKSLSQYLKEYITRANKYEEYSKREYVIFIDNMLNILADSDKKERRAIYYQYIDKNEFEFSDSAEKAKTIINRYYNKVVYSSILNKSPNNGYEFTYDKGILDSLDIKMLRDNAEIGNNMFEINYSFCKKSKEISVITWKDIYKLRKDTSIDNNFISALENQLKNNTTNKFENMQLRLQMCYSNMAMSFGDLFNQQREVLCALTPILVGSSILTGSDVTKELSEICFDALSFFFDNSNLLENINYSSKIEKTIDEYKLLEIKKKYIIKRLTKEALDKELKGEQKI